MQKREIVKKNLSFKGILLWLNEEFKVKKTGKPFNNSDVQGYILRGGIPKYIGGGYTIVSTKESKYTNRTYNIVK
jgi:hypothetical protein